MADPKRLLVAFHSRSGGVRAMTEAVVEGAHDPAIENVEVRMQSAFDTDGDDLRWADGVILGTPENFGYMSGAMKDLFDRTYYDVLDDTRGLPYALFVKGRSDGTGAVRAVERIVTGLAWKAVLPPIVVVGDLEPEHLDACRELGATMAAGLELALF